MLRNVKLFTPLGQIALLSVELIIPAGQTALLFV